MGKYIATTYLYSQDYIKWSVKRFKREQQKTNEIQTTNWISPLQNTPSNIVKQETPDYIASINFCDTIYAIDNILSTFLMI